MRALSLIAVCCTLSAGACATAARSTGESIARLEQQQKAKPASIALNRALGIAYYKEARYPDARRALETAARLEPSDGTTALYLGLTAEAQNDVPAARQAYSSYLKFGRTSRVRSQLEARLAALARKELLAEARSAVAQEQSLGTVAGSPRTVAVLPLRFSGSDSSLRPLERGLADLLTTDLSRSAQLTLVERSRMQALLDEIALQRGGRTDAGTNVRAGRMVRAGRVVQGSILQLPGSQLRVDAAVVNVGTAQVQGSAEGVDQIEQIFNIEKRIAMELFRQLGVTLTVAERNAVEQRPTRSLAAFVAYSRGLTAQDEGRYDDASRFFQDAVRIDPSFSGAAQKGQETRAISAGTAVSAQTVETSLKGTSEGTIVTAAVQGTTTAASAAPAGSSTLGGTAKAAAGDVNASPSSTATAGASTSTTTAGAAAAAGSAPGTKDPVTGGIVNAETPTGTGKVTITIVRPRP